MYQINQAMLMTAGLGTRLKPFTDVTTKALLPLMGVPMTQYALDALVYAGVRKVVANVHHQYADTIQGLNGLDPGSSKLVISDESSVLLGSAGGVRLALPFFDGKPFFRANADVICDVDWKALAKRHFELRKKWGVRLTLAVFPRGPASGLYREILFDKKKGLITGLGGHQTGRPFFIGAAVIEPEAMDKVPQSRPSEFVPEVLEPAIAENKAGVFLTRGHWYDIGSPDIWLLTHLEMIRRLERDQFENPYEKLWKRRIKEACKQVQPRIWATRSSWKEVKRIPRLRGPSFLAGLSGEETIQKLGPQAVLYGVTEGSSEFSRGIGYGGQWISL